MRARKLRPVFDRLDTRIVFDASGADMVCGGTGTTLLSSGTSGQQDLVQVLDWYLPGSPTPVATDPTAITAPMDLLTTN